MVIVPDSCMSNTQSSSYPMVESILGTGFDLSGAKTAAKLDSLAMEVYRLKRDGPVFSFRASPRHNVSLVRVPATTTRFEAIVNGLIK